MSQAENAIVTDLTERNNQRVGLAELTLFIGFNVANIFHLAVHWMFRDQ